MFSRDEVEKVVGLQQKSYQLLRWVGEELRGGTLRFGTMHESLSFAEAAQEWLERNFEGLPADTRPDKADIEPFAHLFASYLQTSYELVEKPGERLVSRTGCYCRFCTYLRAGSNLHLRMPDKKARDRARQMKEFYLVALATEAGRAAPYEDTARLLADPALAEDISWATYANELLRRSQFASQGEGALVLWREITWDKSGRIKKRFALSAERILSAESRLIKLLHAAS